jgi:hypothetical protein
MVEKLGQTVEFVTVTAPRFMDNGLVRRLAPVLVGSW